MALYMLYATKGSLHIVLRRASVDCQVLVVYSIVAAAA